MILARVLLPEPLRPMMACTSPGLTFRSTPRRISLSPTPACRFLIVNSVIGFSRKLSPARCPPNDLCKLAALSNHIICNRPEAINGSSVKNAGIRRRCPFTRPDFVGIFCVSQGSTSGRQIAKRLYFAGSKIGEYVAYHVMAVPIDLPSKQSESVDLLARVVAKTSIDNGDT